MPDWTVETVIILQLIRACRGDSLLSLDGGMLFESDGAASGQRAKRFFPSVVGPDRPDGANAGEAGLNDRLAVAGGGFGRGLFEKGRVNQPLLPSHPRVEAFRQTDRPRHPTKWA